MENESAEQMILKGFDKKQIKSFVKVFNALSNGQFDKVWQGRDYVCFKEFILGQVLSRNLESNHFFLVALAIPANRIIWLFYELEGAYEKSGHIRIEKWKLDVAMPEHPGDCECPKQWKGYPVWRAGLN